MFGLGQRGWSGHGCCLRLVRSPCCWVLGAESVGIFDRGAECGVCGMRGEPQDGSIPEDGQPRTLHMRSRCI